MPTTVLTSEEFPFWGVGGAEQIGIDIEGSAAHLKRDDAPCPGVWSPRDRAACLEGVLLPREDAHSEGCPCSEGVPQLRSFPKGEEESRRWSTCEGQEAVLEAISCALWVSVS